MSIEFDPKKSEFNIELDENDIKDAILIQQMMNHPGWIALHKYFIYGRELVINSGKEGIKTMGTKDLSAIKFAILKGIDECIAIPERIVERYKQDAENKDLKRRSEEPNYDE